MTYELEQIESWANEGSVTSSHVTLEMVAEIKRLREDLENQNGYTLAVIDSCDKSKGIFITTAKQVISHWDEFGPNHGFEKTIDFLRSLIGGDQ